MAVKISAVIAEKITASNNEAFDSVLDRDIEFKRIGMTTTTGVRSPKDHKPDRIANDEGDDQSPTYSKVGGQCLLYDSNKT